MAFQFKYKMLKDQVWTLVAKVKRRKLLFRAKLRHPKI